MSDVAGLLMQVRAELDAADVAFREAADRRARAAALLADALALEPSRTRGRAIQARRLASVLGRSHTAANQLLQQAERQLATRDAVGEDRGAAVL